MFDKAPNNLRNRWLAPLALSAALLILLIAAGVTYLNLLRLSESADWVAHTRRVMTSTESILADLSEAESAGRGFLLTGDSLYRDQFDRSAESVDAQQIEMRSLTRDNPEQQTRIVQLTELLTPKIALMRKFVSYRDTPDRESAEEYRMLADGTRQMSEVRSLINEVATTIKSSDGEELQLVDCQRSLGR